MGNRFCRWSRPAPEDIVITAQADQKNYAFSVFKVVEYSPHSGLMYWVILPPDNHMLKDGPDGQVFVVMSNSVHVLFQWIQICFENATHFKALIDNIGFL